jgi:hypothetical protein
MSFSKASSLVLAFISILASGPVLAEPLRGVAYTGGTISESVSGYAGAVVSLPGAQLGDGAAIRGGIAGGRYEYDASGTEIVGKYASAEVALAYQFSGKWGWANVSAGPHFAHTTLSPLDPQNARRGSRWDLTVQSDGAFDSPRWRLGWFGSYGAFDQAYQARLQLGRRIGRGDLRLGLEAGVQGDPRYTRVFGGAFASKPIGKNLDLLVAVGASEQAGRSTRGYGSVALSKLF